MSKTVPLVNTARLEISNNVRSHCALCGQFVDISLRCDSPLPGTVTEDRSKVTCRSCLRLMRSPSPYDRAELRRKVSNAPDFGETWEGLVQVVRMALSAMGLLKRTDTSAAILNGSG